MGTQMQHLFIECALAAYPDHPGQQEQQSHQGTHLLTVYFKGHWLYRILDTRQRWKPIVQSAQEQKN